MPTPPTASDNLLSSSPTYPRWIDRDDAVNLREVAPSLYVGAVDSPFSCHWRLIVDLYGSTGRSQEAKNQADYLILTPMLDGSRFGPGVLDLIVKGVKEHQPEGPVLIHCQAGLSRSTSAAYAALRKLGGLSHDRALSLVKVHSDFPREDTLASARRWVHTGRP